MFLFVVVVRWVVDMGIGYVRFLFALEWFLCSDFDLVKNYVTCLLGVQVV